MGLHVRIPDLIAEVYPRRPLWDREDPGNKDKALINQLWTEVAKKCSITRLFARTKWKQLRYTFGTQLKKSKHKTPQWKWFKDLSFLTDQFINNINSVEDGIYSCEDKSEQPPVLSMNEEASSTDESCPLAELQTMDLACQKNSDYPVEENFPVLHTPSNEYTMQSVQSVTDSDANYYFLMSLLPQMSVLPLTKQWLLRLKIHELVVKEVLAHQNENQMNGSTLVLSD